MKMNKIKSRLLLMIVTVLVLSQQMMIRTWAGIEFTEVSTIMEAKEKVDVTEQPDESSAVIVTFEKGDPILVTGQSDSGWYRVLYQEQVGYVKVDSIKGASVADEEAIEQLDEELDEMEQTNKIIIEEVVRVQEELKRSRIMTAVIVVLIIGILAAGIYSTIKANRDDSKSAETDGDKDEAHSENTHSENPGLKLEENSSEKENNAPENAEEDKLEIIDLDAADLGALENENANGAEAEAAAETKTNTEAVTEPTEAVTEPTEAVAEPTEAVAESAEVVTESAEAADATVEAAETKAVDEEKTIVSEKSHTAFSFLAEDEPEAENAPVVGDEADAKDEPIAEDTTTTATVEDAGSEAAVTDEGSNQEDIPEGIVLRNAGGVPESYGSDDLEL